MRYNKEHQLLEFIKSFQNTHSYPPTVREMCRAINVNSTSTIAYYISKKEKNGLIKKSPFKNRALEVVQNEDNDKIIENTPSFTRIPLVGTITAGVPILAVENTEEYFMVTPNMFRGDDLFMLSVRGDSMINAGIFDGDKIVVQKCPTAENGEIVAAMIDGSATVKRFYKENGHYRLQPENDTMAPIITDDVTILGKVIGLLRKF